MLLKSCPRCKRMVPYGQAYCKDCQPIVNAERAEAMEQRAALRSKKYNKEYNSRRDTTSEIAKFRRSKPWKNTSKSKLDSCGYKCEARLDDKCGRIACEVHHIKPLKTPEGWAERLEWSNLLGVCVHCHNILDGKNFKRRQEDDGVIDMSTITR